LSWPRITADKRSHWNDARERIETKDFEVKLWEAGQTASAKAALTLLESRAHQAVLAIAEDHGAGASWPEFAEYDCFSCHQRLRPVEGNRKAPAAGFPEWGDWNLAFVAANAEAKELNALRAEMKKAYAAQPEAVEIGAASTRKALAMILLMEEPTSNKLLELLDRSGPTSKSWEVLCQRYLAQRVIEKSIGDELHKLELAGHVSAPQRRSFNERRDEIDRTLAKVGEQLAFAKEKKEWPRILDTPSGIEKMESDLRATAGKLRMLQSHLEQRR
jgi:hypothetical protein